MNMLRWIRGFNIKDRKRSTKGAIDLDAFGKPRLYINIHHYAPPIGCTVTAQHAAGSAGHQGATSLAAARRCGFSEGSTSF